MKRGPIYIVGAGGHGKVVLSAALALGLEVAGVLDDDTEKLGARVLGVPVIGTPEDVLSSMPHTSAAPGIGDNRTRREVVLRLSPLSIEWIPLVHPAAFVHPSAQVGEGSVVFAGAVIQPDCRIGAHCIVNTGALIDHDCVIGDFCHVAPGCAIAGGVGLGEGAFLGIGAAIIPGVTVGAWATVGAGSTVIRDVPPGATVVGTPARPIHEVKP
ncbi:MAG: acetyltransferase [Synergistaceae bacterium]|nr:acetyltransferase [Synergistota bacterium]NLM72277.1 acetyltransferase [Synergistaceae bacterium]